MGRSAHAERQAGCAGAEALLQGWREGWGEHLRSQCAVPHDAVRRAMGAVVRCVAGLERIHPGKFRSADSQIRQNRRLTASPLPGWVGTLAPMDSVVVGAFTTLPWRLSDVSTSDDSCFVSTGP